MKVAGIVLAGGLSRRMGGKEKSLLQLGQTSPIAEVASRLARQVPAVAVNANGDPKRFDFLQLPVIADSVEGFVGPLAGVLAGMHWAKEHNATHVVTAAADTPFLPTDFVSRLCETLQSDTDIAMAASGDRVHPVFGVWPVVHAGELEHFLVAEDKRKILEFANRYVMHEVEFSTEGGDPFFNINTPEDLEKARMFASRTNT